MSLWHRAGVLTAAGLALVAAGLASCSFTTATGFDECATDVQCDAGAVCSARYCLSLPPRCERAEGAFDDAQRIPLAALLPLTQALDGGVADEKEAMRLNAMRLAVSEVNAAEGVKGRPFALFACDTGRNDDELRAQVRWFVTQLQVPVVLTSGSSQTKAAALEPSRVDAGTMVLSPSATSPELIDVFVADPTVWRVAPPDSLQAKVLVELLETEPVYRNPDGGAPKSVSVVYEDTSYGRGLLFRLGKELERVDGGIFRSRAFPSSSGLEPAVLSGIVSGLAAEKPDVTVLAGLPLSLKEIIDAAQQSAALTRAGGHRWLFPDSAKSPVLLGGDAGAELVGLLGVAPAQGAGVVFSVFSDRFRNRFGQDPGNYSYTSQSYDAAYLAMLASAWALGQGGALTGPRLSEGLRNVAARDAGAAEIGPASWQQASNALYARSPVDLAGTSGPLDFDVTSGAPPAPYEVWRIEANRTFSKVREVIPPP